jgi:hypothetical protein
LTTISAKIITDSISPEGKRLPTKYLRYPLVIHAELKTHRVFSTNSRSSRAVPAEKMIQEALDDPFIPLHWGAAQKGMQAYKECNAPIVFYEDAIGCDNYSYHTSREAAWLAARNNAVDSAWGFHKAGYAKQIVNRLLAPFLHIDTLVTATEWDNFFELRDHHAAEPHMQMLAKAMKRALAESTPEDLQPGEWHLPYADDADSFNAAAQYVGKEFPNSPGPDFNYDRIQETLRRLSAARCARISYAPFDGEGSIEAELKRYDTLIEATPIHASPVEHQATPDKWFPADMCWGCAELHGNFDGWIQNRKLIEMEVA